MTKYNKYLFYIASLILASFLIFKLFQLSKVIVLFPSYDFSSHISNLFFLKEYGFHSIAPNWYNGMVILRLYPPGFFIYSLIFYSIIDNVQLAFYISLLSIFIVGFFGIYLLGRCLNFSFDKILFLFFFFYSNPLTTPWFYSIGRIPEMFAWSLIFYLIAIVFYYKDKVFDKRFFIYSAIILSAILLAHPFVFILASSLLIGLFLIKNNKEKLIIISLLPTIIILCAFWLIDFIKHINEIAYYTPNIRFLYQGQEVIYSILIPFILITTFYLYVKVKKLSRKEVIFYIPIIFIAFIYLTHIFYYIPFIRSIEPRSYSIFLFIISTILILDFKPNKKASKLLYTSILIFSLIITTASFIRYNEIDFPIYNQDKKEILDLFPLVEKKFIIIDKDGDINKKNLYAFGAVKYNLSTPLGWSMEQSTKETKDIIKKLKDSIDNKDCELLNSAMDNYQVEEIISHKDNCDFLKTCSLNVKKELNEYCLLSK